MSDPTIEVTRYPNRRLYDRSRGQYVTLQELEQLVRDGRTICVRDSKTGEDLTRTILTQIILERFPERMDLIPVPLLHMLLRANDLALDWLRTYLRQSLAFLEQMPGSMLSSGFTPPQAFTSPPSFTPPTPFAAATPFTPPVDWMRSLFAPWQEMPSQQPKAESNDQAEPESPLASTSLAPPPDDVPPDDAPASDTDPRDNQLLQRMLQLEQRLRELEATRSSPPSTLPDASGS